LRWPHKLLVRPDDDLVELYDLSADPSERRDLSERSPELVAELTRLYRSFPPLRVDRSPRARRLREQTAQAPPSR